MGTAHILRTAFNSHQSESNLINTGKRLPGETIHNDDFDATVTEEMEKKFILRKALQEAKKSSAKITLRKTPWE